MKFQRRRGVSVIIATLLLIAISVTAAILVYVFVSGAAGDLLNNGAGEATTEHLTILSYNFAVSPGSCSCSQEVLEIYLENTGPSPTTVSSVTFDGVLMSLGSASTTPTSFTNDQYYPVSSADILGDAGTAGQLSFNPNTPMTTYSVTSVGQIVITFTTAVAYGTSHTVKVISTTGAQNTFIVLSGKAG